MGELHVVLGAGQVGPRVAQALVERGHRVRVVRRTSTPLALAGVEGVSADVGDADAVAAGDAGAGGRGRHEPRACAQAPAGGQPVPRHPRSNAPMTVSILLLN